MRRIVRLACLGGLAAIATVGAVSACSSDSTDSTDPPTPETDGGADVVSPGTDGGGSDVVVADQVAPPEDAPVDAGPACTTASCAIAIGAGPNHTCAVLGDHTLKCWGDNSHGELGTGSVVGTTVTPSVSTKVVAVAGLTDVAAMAGGGEPGAPGTAFTCVMSTTGAVRCWGSNGYGQLGGATDAAVSVTPNAVPLDASASNVDLGSRHGCVVDTTGALRCWGDNTYGVRGNPALSAIALPTDAGASSVSAGFFSTCVATKSGEAVCFGNNGNGQVNPYSAAASTPPSIVDAGAPVSAVSAGQLFVCAAQDASVSCWGTNQMGQLGRSGALALNLPASVQFTAGIAPVSVQAGVNHACAIMADRGVTCWGANGRGQSADFSGKTQINSPNGVGGVANVVQLALGYEHSCALLASGEIYCWGSNVKGQLGPNGNADGGTDTVAHPDPVKVPL